MSERSWAGASILPALLLAGAMLGAMMVALLVAMPAEARDPAVAVDITESRLTIDASLRGAAVGTFSGTASVTENAMQTATVYLSVDPSGWAAEVTPDQKVVSGNETFSFSVAVTPAEDAPDGGHLVRVIARAETAGGNPVTAQDSITVVLVRNRVRIEAPQTPRIAAPGDTVDFAVKVYNDGSTKDTFSTAVEKLAGRFDRVSYLLDQGSLDVDSGGFVYFNVEFNLTRGAPPGDYSVVFTASSSASDTSVSQQVLTVTIPGPHVAKAGPAGQNYLLWTGISVLVLGACLMVFIGGTEIGLLAFLQFVLVPLFVRIKKDQVLDHFTRGQIFGFIKANPGTHYIAIQEHLELQNGVLAYHLKVLEREEYIVSERDSIYKRFYPRHMKIPQKERQLSRVQRDIVSALRTHPGASQNGLARMLGESKQVVGYHIRVLQKAALVRVERDAQQTRCYIEGAPLDAGPTEELAAPQAPEELPEIIRDIHA